MVHCIFVVCLQREYAKSRYFQTNWKGWGLQAAEDMDV